MRHSIVEYAPRNGPGHAWLATPFPATSAARVTLRRTDVGSKTYLGPAGWQDPPFGFSVLEAVADGKGGRLLLGPAICNALEPDVSIAIDVEDLAAPAGSWSSPAFLWPEIRRSGRPAGAEFLRPDAARPATEPTRKPAQEAPDPRSAPLRPGTRKQAPEELPTEDAGSKQVDPIVDSDPGPGGTSGGTPWLVPIVLALLLSFGSGAGYLGYSFWPEPWCTWFGYACPLAPGREVASEEEPAILSIVSEGPERWMAVTADPGTPSERLMELGLALRRKTDDPVATNQGFEAIYTAGYRDHPAALMWLARAYDPSIAQDPGGMGEARNALSALEYYRKAMSRNVEGAASGRDALCSWLKERRFQGGAAARQAFDTHCGNS